MNYPNNIAGPAEVVDTIKDLYDKIAKLEADLVKVTKERDYWYKKCSDYEWEKSQ